MGSTGVPINYDSRFRGSNPCENTRSPDCQRVQLAFSSDHPGGAQGVLCDGSVRFFQDDVDLIVWRDYGTRASQVPATVISR